MMNKYQKSYYKSELAALADVSYATFSAFLRAHREQLAALGVSPMAQKLRGRALEYVCREYDIDLPDDGEPPVRKHEKFR